MILQDDNQSSSGDIFVPSTPAYKETNDLVVLDNPEEQENLGQAQKLKWLMVSQPFPFLYVFFLLITNLVTRVVTYSVEIAL
jgi:hypothetical protein